MMTATLSLTKARDALAELEATVAAWVAKRETATAEADRLEAGAGERVLRDPDSADDVENEITRLRTAATVASRAVGAGRSEVDKARSEVLAAAASEVRSRAKRRRGDADERETKLAPLLAQLEELDGRGYGPLRELYNSLSGTTRTEVGTTGAVDLRAEADRLDALAQQLTAVAQGGPVSDAQFEQLLAGADPEGPEATERDARAAKTRADAEAQAERQQRDRAVRQAWIEARTERLRVEHRWSEERSCQTATAEFREAAQGHSSFQAAVEALEGSGDGTHGVPERETVSA